MHTILGAGGVIGRETARALASEKQKIRLVSRNPKKVNPDDECLSADLTDAAQVRRAVEGSEVAYLTVGLPYEIKVWQRDWPVIMKNSIEACKAHGTRLVFFDNIYMYDPDYLGHMTEETPIRPVSKKGQVREHISRMLMEAVEKGELEALIARAADFYGPQNDKSVLVEIVFKNLAAGKKADWMGSVDKLHSFTYTPDAGIGTAMLGMDKEAFNRVWHLPTAPPLPNREWIELTAEALGKPFGYRVAGRRLVKFLGLFNSLMKELGEMLYQYELDYVFDSSAFEKRYGYTPVSPRQGIINTARADFL